MSNAALTDDNPVDPDDELLVAYLDGELDAKTENELMDRLTSEQGLNERLRRLQEGWELLDTLPGVASNEKLVESTLELVVADIVKEKPKSASKWSQHRYAIVVVLACIAAAAASIVVTSIIRSRQYQQELRDLEIAQHLNAYLIGDDLTLMRRLSVDPSWAQMIAAAQEIGEFKSVSNVSIAEVPVDERTELVESLPLEERAPLADRWGRFQRMDPESEQQVRRTAEAVAIQPDGETLLETMDLYAVWVEKLSPELRDQIESEDPKVQRKAISEAIAITQSSTIWRSRDQLSDEAVERIYFALRQILQQRIDAGDEATIRHVAGVQNWFESAEFRSDDFDPEPFVIMGLVVDREEVGRLFRGRRGPMFAGRNRPDRPAPLSDDELEMIRLILPDDAHDTLELVSSRFSVEDTLVLRALTLRGWAEEATRRKMPQRPASTLLERYNDLLPSERERFDLLPPKEMLERIERVARPGFPPR